jgi:Domain of unknown function (DUF4136)
MKKLMVFELLSLALLSSCYKYPDTSQLSSNFVVLTNYDNAANFKSYKTFILPPYVGLISSTSSDSILDPQYGDQILSAIQTNLTARGYTEVPNNHTADLGVSAVALKETTIVTGWYPGSWWGYPGWGGCYWYYCGYYPIYPPYYTTYVYQTGSLIIELVDLKNLPPPSEGNKLDVLWTNWNGGALGSSSTNLQNALQSINQAFVQSPYISAQ